MTSKEKLTPGYEERLTPKYEAGQKVCPICSIPLPAHQVWGGAKYRFCGSPECATKVKKLPRGRYINANEYKCELTDCSNFVPEGRYYLRSYLCCSAACWYRRHELGSMVLTCACGCGTEFTRRKKKRNDEGLVFLDVHHAGAYQREKLASERCGRFRGTFDEYLSGYAASHYRDSTPVRQALYPFLSYMNEHGIDELDAVTPKTITHYLAWADRTGRRNAVQALSALSVFFQWSIVEGHREHANPVIPRFHARPKQYRMPRPLEESEMELLWQVLDQRGNARLRLAAAISSRIVMRGTSRVSMMRLPVTSARSRTSSRVCCTVLAGSISAGRNGRLAS
jgi:integrase/recombinase XerC